MKRRALSLLLTGLLLVSPGCITAALWEDHDGSDTAWATAGRAVLTPLTVAADTLIVGGAIWAQSKLDEDHHHHCD